MYFADLRQDIRHGLRVLAGSPGFTSVALISLTLGIAIATSAYSEMNGMILRDLPAVLNPDSLVALQLPMSLALPHQPDPWVALGRRRLGRRAKRPA